jgi:deoxyribose-phosphate aldolase
MSLHSVIAAVEHTRLKADTTPADIDQLCREALEHGFAGVCVNPVYVPQVNRALAGSEVAVVTVVGFPLGASSIAADVAEAEWTVSQGAREVDMVIPIGLALSGDYAAVTRHVTALRRATEGVILKVIFECGFFTPEQLRSICLAAAEAGPDYLKTATGFGPRGATEADVHLLAAVAAQSKPTAASAVDGTARKMAVKASGGVRNLADAQRMLAAGASRLGTSSGVAIARELNAAAP